MQLQQTFNIITHYPHMVKTIQNGIAINVHPGKKTMYSLVLSYDVTRVNSRRTKSETDGFVVCYAITKRVDLVEFIEYVSVIVLYSGG